MYLMRISILLGVLLCVALLAIAMLCCLLAKEIDDRVRDKLSQTQMHRALCRCIAAFRTSHWEAAPRIFYDQDRDPLDTCSTGQ